MTANRTLPAELTGDWTIDAAHTRIGFAARHAMVSKVRGGFNEFEGSLHLDADNPGASSAQLTIQVASIDTRNAQRDAHLRTNDFFDAPTFPQITFASRSVTQIDAEHFEVRGDLTIKDVTKAVDVRWELTGVATDPFGNLRAGFEGTATLNRTDYGVNFNATLEAGGVLVSEKVTLELDVEAVKNAPATESA
ncbi:MAG: YceI family protein [Dermatophilaceae bacterium]